MKKKKQEKHPPKFKTKYLEKRAPHDARLDTLKRWCAVFHESGLAPSYGAGSHGNLSFRLKRHSRSFIITASAIRLKNRITRRSFFKVTDTDTEKNQVTGVGVRQPSSESFMHACIYKKRRDVNAIFHGHCSEILQKARELKLPVSRREEPYGTPAMARSIASLVGRHSFVIMKNHGFVSCGRDMAEAGLRALAMLLAAKDLSRR